MKMMKSVIEWWCNQVHKLLCLGCLFLLIACSEENSVEPTAEDFSNLLRNQVEQVVIPTMTTYAQHMADLSKAVENMENNITSVQIDIVRSEFKRAYVSYQAAAVHNYYATANQSLVETSNLFPIEESTLEELITNKTYDFNTSKNSRANGFPAIDFMLYHSDNTLEYFEENPLRLDFLQALVTAMKNKADVLVNQWNGNLKTNFVENGGTQLGSSISVQLNQTLLYYEKRIREDKIGIPIGRLGPNDTPILPSPNSIEAYHESRSSGNQEFTLSLVKAAVQEMEDIYLGSTRAEDNAMGYDDLLTARDQAGTDADIKSQYANIYAEIDRRSSIGENDQLYEEIQNLITLYKSDLFPLLNVQDADGKNDGD